MHCPKDKIPCDTKLLQDVNIDVCPKCDGVWLDKSEVRRLTRHFSLPEYSDVDELLEKWEVAENKGTVPKDFWQEDRLVCPVDGVKMKKHYFAGSHIGVDQCQVCEGFWLDGGELHAVAAYVGPDPNLDKAWQLYIQGDNEARKRLQEAELIPARLGLMMLSPRYVLFVIGNVVVQTIINIINSRASRERRKDE